MKTEQDLSVQIAERHGVSQGAVSTALDALKRGGGAMAQFSHPDFGGMAQWSKGGMSMVGDMFNSALKAKFDAVMSDLSTAISEGAAAPSHTPEQDSSGASDKRLDGHQSGHWPSEFGAPSSSGGQNDMRYAFFPEVRRLIVENGDRRTVYDTDTHRISGVSQQQSATRSLHFQSQDGDVRLEDLTVVG